MLRACLSVNALPLYAGGAQNVKKVSAFLRERKIELEAGHRLSLCIPEVGDTEHEVPLEKLNLVTQDVVARMGDVHLHVVIVDVHDIHVEAAGRAQESDDLSRFHFHTPRPFKRTCSNFWQRSP